MRRGSQLVAAALLAVAFAVSAVVAVPASAGAATGTFSGSCQFSGPITPTPPITVIPKSGSAFSYAGSGTCSGTLNGTAVTSALNTLTFTNASTLFDTCEFGPDFGLAGQMVIGTAPDAVHFGITIDLARLALAGPFELMAAGGGSGVGTATFTPPSTEGGVEDCAAGGISTATLAGSFNTTSTLEGVASPTTATTTTSPGQPPTAPHCQAPGHLMLKLHPSRGQRVVSAVLYIDGRRFERVRGHRLSAFRLRPLSGGAHTVKVVTRTSAGRIQTIIRRYRVCG